MRCRGTPDPRDESLAAHLMRVGDDYSKAVPDNPRTSKDSTAILGQGQLSEWFQH